MTIKEQLEEAITDKTYSMFDKVVDGIPKAAIECESIVEDVAVKFGKFLVLEISKNGIQHTPEELFKLFKKENNL